MSGVLHAGLITLLLNIKAPADMTQDVGAMSVSLYDGKTRAATNALLKREARASPSREKPASAEIQVDPPRSPEVEPRFIDATLRQPDADARPALDDPVALSVAALARAATGSPCDLTSWLKQALQDDPQVRQALARLPRPARSVANAIMLWDGGWVAPRATAVSDLAAVRSALLSGIAAAPETCRDVAIRGPELLALSDGMSTTVVVVGSGLWRWVDLLEADGARPQAGAGRTLGVAGPP